MSDAIQQAIEALRMTKYCIPAYGFHAEKVTIDEAIAGLQALQSGEAVAEVTMSFGGYKVLRWLKTGDLDDYPEGTKFYTTPQPVVPAQWRVVMRGMVEYAECNDPGNPYLDQAKALLSAGKGGE